MIKFVGLMLRSIPSEVAVLAELSLSVSLQVVLDALVSVGFQTRQDAFASCF